MVTTAAVRSPGRPAQHPTPNTRHQVGAHPDREGWRLEALGPVLPRQLRGPGGSLDTSWDSRPARRRPHLPPPCEAVCPLLLPLHRTLPATGATRSLLVRRALRALARHVCACLVSLAVFPFSSTETGPAIQFRVIYVTHTAL